MEVRVRERLVGALVLVAIVVLFVPAILRGRAPAPAAPPDAAPTRRVEVPIDSAAPAPEEQILVPEPALPETRPEIATAPVPAPDSGPAKPEVAPPPTPSPGPRAATTEAPAQPAPASVPPAAASAWAVQLGAFSNKSKAEQLVAELRTRRYAAFLLEYRASGQVLYRVRVGPEQDRARAVEIAGRLEKDGFQPVVARHP